jgi:GMP synthase-like glutamine amidotransferase
MNTKSNNSRPILILQNCRIESAGLILPALQELNHDSRIVRTYAGEKIPELDDHKGVICLGCPESANDYVKLGFLGNVYRTVERTLKEELPYLGICCGGQILALTLGAQVTKNYTKEIGTYQVTLTQQGLVDPMFDSFPEKIAVFHWHGDTFGIPAGATHVACGDDCRNQAFRYKNAIGLQFHLEADPKEIPLWCEAYASEMAELNKMTEQIVSAHSEVVNEAARLNRQLLFNLFGRG